MSGSHPTLFDRPPQLVPRQTSVEHWTEIDEACARLRRGETLEALFHLERAIPALDGLRAAVLHLAGRPFND